MPRHAPRTSTRPPPEETAGPVSACPLHSSSADALWHNRYSAEGSLWQIRYSDGAISLDFRASVRPGTSAERSNIIGGHGGSAVIGAPVAVEHLGTQRRERCAAAARTARRGRDHGFGEGLVHAVEQKPRALVRHAHVSRCCRDRAGIPDAFEQPGLAGTNARAGHKN